MSSTVAKKVSVFSKPINTTNTKASYLATHTLVNGAFDVKWDWLMPVLEKISQHVYDSQEEDDGTGTIRTIRYRAYPRTFGMITEEGKFMCRINRMPLHEADTLIEATYNAVVEWVKFYNEKAWYERQ